MTNTMPERTATAAEVEQLRNLVLDLGDAVTRLTAEVAVLQSAPARQAADRELADAVADMTAAEWREWSS